MGKFADRYFGLDPWKITEQGFDPAYGRVGESVFSLANEHLGVRGFFDEGYSGDSMPDCYVSGVYAVDDSLPRSYKGIVTKTHFMVNTLNWLAVDIRFAGEQLDLHTSRFSDFSRELDLASGVLTRSFVWQTQAGKELRLLFRRFLDMDDIRFGCQEICVTPLGFDGELVMTPRLDWDVTHELYDMRFWELVSEDADGLTVRTRDQGFTLYARQRCEGFGTIPLKSGQTAVVRRVCGVDTRPISDPIPAFSAVEERAARFWKKAWQTADVVIDGDPENQQGIRFGIFQLIQTYGGRGEGHNIGAKGLTGEFYNGHAFWDTEICCMPYYLFTNPKAARSLLDFRVKTLPQARERARMLDCKGACYPVATLNGEEACTLWQHANLQLQPTTAVAYALWQYVVVTGDTSYLYDVAFDMLMEIAVYLASRVGQNPETGEYGYYGVMGPDEFHLMVNNNAYTNYMGKKTLLFAAETAERANKEHAYDTARWREIAQHMILPRHGDLIEQHDGFFSLPHKEIQRIPADEFPLYHHWSYDRIYRSDMIKQADTLMLFLLWGGDFSLAEKRANYEYYESRTIHESSLSPSVHSILAAELGLLPDALQFFGFATRLDLDNYNRNAGEGLHITSIAAAWQNIVEGFAGLRVGEDGISLAPYLPDGWTRLSFALLWRGTTLRVTVSGESCDIRRESGDPIALRLHGKELTV
ncbi:MAG: family 65 glycosyl hydrolase [Clostridiales bacterium]|nr:family 65 glycosyl hydrolase [Clostridiales bacterium]